MVYRRFEHREYEWFGVLGTDGWARFYERGGPRLDISMKAVCATQEQAEAYVKAKTKSLARDEPRNTYIPVEE